MKRTSKNETFNPVLVDLNTLQNMLCIGKQSADKIGVAAGAVVRIGKRKVYNVKKIEQYVDSIAEE